MEYAGIGLVPLLIGVIEVFKKLGLNERYVPLFSLALGITAGVLLIGEGDLKLGIIQGILVGLSAVGFYSGTKNTIEKRY